MSEPGDVSIEQVEACRKLTEALRSFVKQQEQRGLSHYTITVLEFNELRARLEKVEQLWDW